MAVRMAAGTREASGAGGSGAVERDPAQAQGFRCGIFSHGTVATRAGLDGAETSRTLTEFPREFST